MRCSHDRTRYLRAKALAEGAVLASGVRHTVFAPSFVYAPGDPFLTMIERLAKLLPVVPVSGRGRALYQPIWAEDVADAIAASLAAAGGEDRRYELAGPELLLTSGDRRARPARRRAHAPHRQRADPDRQPRAACS